MRRGDVHEYTHGGSRVRIVILSATSYNPDRAAYAVIRGPDVPAPRTPVIVVTTDADPVRGSVNLTRLRPVVGDNLGARLGRMSRTTMELIDVGLRNYLSL